MSRIWLPAPSPRRGARRRPARLPARCGLAARSAALALGGCDSRGPRAAQALLRARRAQERARRARAVPPHRDERPVSARAPAAGRSFPSYFVSEMCRSGTRRARGVVAARGRRAGRARRCGSRSTISTALPRTRGCGSITSASKAGSAVAVRTGVRLSRSRAPRRRVARRPLRRLPVVRRRLSRELGHRERDASADARRLRPGRRSCSARRTARRRASIRRSSSATRTRST